MNGTLHALHLAAGVHGAQVGDDLVLLDLPRGRYLCLSEVRLDGHDVVHGPADRLGEMAAAGLGRSEPAPAVPQLRALPPGRSVEPSPPQASGLALCAWAVADAARGYWGRPLSRLVADAARRRRSPGPATPELLHVAARFQGAAPYIPLSAKCLLRSYLLLRLLRRRGHDALWVFGVRTWPFAAHCWLQADDVVLDDHWERVRAYVPILVV